MRRSEGRPQSDGSHPHSHRNTIFGGHETSSSITGGEVAQERKGATLGSDGSPFKARHKHAVAYTRHSHSAGRVSHRAKDMPHSRYVYGAAS